MTTKRALLIATVAQSHVHQSPATVEVLEALGFEITYLAAKDRFFHQLERRGRAVPLPLSRRPSASELYRSYKIMHRLLREPWDLVHLASPIASGIARLSPNIRAHKSVYVVHGYHFHRDGDLVSNVCYQILERFLARRTSAVAVVAEEDFRAAQGIGVARAGLLWRLPGAGIDFSEFRYDPGGHATIGYALFCGELNANKDPGTAMDVVRELRKRGHNLRMVVVGDGPLSERLPLDEEWILHKPYAAPEELSQLMREARVLIAPSYREGLPRVILEALSCGTPVVARSNRGSRELLAHPGTGAMVASEDLHEWVSACHEVLMGPRVAEATSQRLAELYGLPSFKSSFEGLIRCIQSDAPPGEYDLCSQSVR